MSIRVVVSVPLQEGETKEYGYVFQKDEITLGRHSRNDIQIPTPQVSADHARIVVSDAGITVVDLGSQAGTTVAGEPIPANEPAPVPEGAEIGLGGCVIRISRDLQEVTPATEEKTQQVAMRMVREVLGSLGGGGSSPYLEVVNDDEQGKTVPVPEEEGSEILAGRESDCALRLSHWSVSRHHARFRRTWQGVTVEDLGSKNGVMLNEVVIKGPQPLHDGDLVFIGHTQLRFRDPSDSLIDQLDDIPTPVSIDIKTSIIDLEEKKAPEKKAGEKRAPEKPPAPDAAAVEGSEETPEPEKTTKKGKNKGESAEGGADAGIEAHGGLGDYLFLIIGILVILGVAAAVVLLFLL